MLEIMMTMTVICGVAAITSFILILNTKDTKKKRKIMKVFSVCVFVFYCGVLIGLLFLSRIRQYSISEDRTLARYFAMNTNFIPFKTIMTYIRALFTGSLNESIILENLLGNVLAFAPMGLLLPILFKKLRSPKWFLGVVLALLIFVELGQLVTQTGSCDIDDVVLNLVGASLVFGLWSLRGTQWILKKAYIID